MAPFGYSIAWREYIIRDVNGNSGRELLLAPFGYSIARREILIRDVN
jgi:hypothetical protein